MANDVLLALAALAVVAVPLLLAWLLLKFDRPPAPREPFEPVRANRPHGKDHAH